MAGRVCIRYVLVLLCGLLLPAGGAGAQGFPVYKESLPVASLNSERLFSESLAGKKILDDARDKSTEIAAENRKIEAELEQEERDLTEKRKSLPADEFRKLADAFDKKVVSIRREQNAKATELSQQLDASRRAFSDRVRPVLQKLMQEKGIIFILDEKAIALAAGSGDITDEALRRVDAQIGATLEDSK
jgi:Skp family chaperone for outer membrane proteins